MERQKSIFFSVISIFILTLLASCQAPVNSSHPHPKPILSSIDTSAHTITIAFGSCNRHTQDQSFWDTIAQHDPMAWIWLGDIIYADTENMQVMKRMYEELKKDPHYARFSRNRWIYGIWDDHDYGVNNGGVEFPAKDGSKKLLFEFLEVPKSHPAQDRPGAYQHYDIDTGGYGIKLILLDVRYFRESQDKPQATMLGSAQWEWLETLLDTNTADLTLIAGGIQFLHRDHKYEKWYNFPKEYRKLLNLLQQHQNDNILLLSGDRHIGEIAALPVEDQDTLWEVTSSGLTHSYHSLKKEENRYRISPIVKTKNFGLLHIDPQSDQLLITIRHIEDNTLAAQKLIPLHPKPSRQ